MVKTGLTYFLSFVLLLATSRLVAQAPLFRTITYDIEKKGTKLLTIFQESRGPLWLGTSMGMCRYDGINFRYLDKDSNQVTAIGETANGVLWMGHENGIIEYTSGSGIERLRMPEHPSSRITRILPDPLQRIWFSTYGEGLYCYDGKSLHHFDVSDGLSDNMVYDIEWQDDSTVWAATDLGITRCRFNKGIRKEGTINATQGLPDNIVRCLSNDAMGKIWIGLQDKGICYFDKHSGTIQIPAEASNWHFGQVNDILVSKKEILIATEEDGVVEIHPGLPALNKMKPAGEKKIAAVEQLLLDRNEQVWMVSDNTLSLANCNHFQIIEIPVAYQDPVKAITTDKDGRIWFANKKGVFTKKDNNSPVEQVRINQKMDYPSIVCLYADKHGTIWIGTYNDGIYRYTPYNGETKHYTKADGLVDNNVFSIAGKGDQLWLGTLGGASSFDGTTAQPKFNNYTRENGLSNNFVYNVYADSKDNIWFSTDGGGISRLGTDGFHHYNNIPGLTKNIVYTSAEDIYGNIWFTGLNAGLFCFDGKSFRHYSIKNGLHDNEILNLVPDNKGNLLLSHPEGLELFNIRRELFTFYGEESGFNEINPEINASCKTTNGNILIGSSDKIIVYYPSETRYTQLPQLVMNDVQLFFKPVEANDQHVFEHDENHLTFNFAGLWYVNPSAVNYVYQLEGNSTDWISTRDHSISFPNLRPGDYVFRVKASINNDFRFAPMITWRFRILQPYWRKTWFVACLLLIAGLAVFYLVRLRFRFLQAKQEKEKQRLAAQLMMLKNQLNPHFLFNSFNTLMNIIDKDKQMAMEFTEKLSDFYRELALLQDKDLISIAEEVTLLKNYIYLQQKRFGNNLRLKLNISEEYLLYQIPPMTLQLLAENAIKHNSITAESPLLISVESAQSFLVVANNINRHPIKVSSAGIGLSNIRQRVQMQTGQDINIIENEQEFNVIIPIKTN